MKRLKSNERCPACGVHPRTLDVELGTYRRKGSAGWRVRVTDPNGDAAVEAEAAGRILVILTEVANSLFKADSAVLSAVVPPENRTKP